MIADFLKPPTDNLYKFMCISGLILIIVSLTFPPLQLNKLAHSYLENRRNLETLQVDSELTDHQSELLNQEADTLNKERESLLAQFETLQRDTESKNHWSGKDKEALRKKLDQLEKLKSEVEQKQKEWVAKVGAVLTTRAEQRKKLIAIEYETRAALWDSRSGMVIAVFAVLTALFGAWMAITGFNRWSLRVQVFQDAILKKQAEENVK